MHKSPWELSYITHKTEKAFLNYIRGGIRQGIWKKAPVKLAFLSQRKTKRMINKASGRMCNHNQCEICEEWIANPGKNMEVDHKNPTNGFSCIEEAGRFIQDLVYISMNDLQHLCKPCHQIKTLADKRGISFKEAKLEKEVIKVMKLKATPLKKWLAKRNALYLTPAKANEDMVRSIIIEEATNYAQ